MHDASERNTHWPGTSHMLAHSQASAPEPSNTLRHSHQHALTPYEVPRTQPTMGIQGNTQPSCYPPCPTKPQMAPPRELRTKRNTYGIQPRAASFPTRTMLTPALLNISKQMQVFSDTLFLHPPVEPLPASPCTHMILVLGLAASQLDAVGHSGLHAVEQIHKH